jgi:hypothetical protein
MATQFSAKEWAQIDAHLKGREATYGLPERRENSVLLGSWNIRKFGGLLDDAGRPSKSDGAYTMVAEYCRRFDLVSIQETLVDLGSVHRLRDDVNAGLAGAPYRLLVSDVTGRAPGQKGNAERMAFLYDTRRVELREIVSDVSLDLGAIVANVNAALRRVREQMVAASPNDLALRVAAWFEQMMPFNQPKLESFLQFIRAPYLAAFRVQGVDAHYDLACVNAHLWYGEPSQREREFFALLDWMAQSARRPPAELCADVMVLMGDLNLDFETSNDKRRNAIETVIVKLNEGKAKTEARVNFPFLDTHQGQAGSFATNARKKETFDHIAWFGRDDRFPRGRHNGLAGTISPDDFDYGVFDFVGLFRDAGVVPADAKGVVDVTRFEFDLSDHMPIWVRLPVPNEGQHRFIVE